MWHTQLLVFPLYFMLYFPISIYFQMNIIMKTLTNTPLSR